MLLQHAPSADLDAKGECTVDDDAAADKQVKGCPRLLYEVMLVTRKMSEPAQSRADFAGARYLETPHFAVLVNPTTSFSVVV